MWEPFTERARRSIVLAQEEAQRLGNNYIGTEHILLGIISEGESLAAKVLETLGVNLAKVRQEVEAIVGRGGQTVQQEIGLYAACEARHRTRFRRSAAAQS
jgi:ATP-dependent Clp protease ATP-binding subunit ClpC